MGLRGQGAALAQRAATVNDGLGMLLAQTHPGVVYKTSSLVVRCAVRA
jgi:hypothetical protein